MHKKVIIEFTNRQLAGFRHRLDQSDEVVFKAILLTKFPVQAVQRSDNLRTSRKHDTGFIQGDKRLTIHRRNGEAESIANNPAHHIPFQGKISFPAVEPPINEYSGYCTRGSGQQYSREPFTCHCPCSPPPSARTDPDSALGSDLMTIRDLRVRLPATQIPSKGLRYALAGNCPKPKSNRSLCSVSLFLC